MSVISQLFNSPAHKNQVYLGFLKTLQSVLGKWKSIKVEQNLTKLVIIPTVGMIF